MPLRRNLLAGLVNSMWSAIVTLAVVPLYLKYLGIEAYGLIGFFATTQAVLQLLDLGLAPTISREVARHSANGNLRKAGSLLHTLAIIYWGTAGVIALAIYGLAPLIADYWLQSKNIPKEAITRAVILMGLVVACRWPIGLYQGVLMGAQRLTVSSWINITMVTLGSFGAVGVLALVSPTIQAFFIWQASVGLLYAATIRWAAWRVLERTDAVRFDGGELKRIWRFSAGMSGIAILAAVLMQLDKVLLSKMLSLEDFGRYALAGLVANALLVLLTPIFNVIYPRLSELVEKADTAELTKLYRSGTRLLSTILFPIIVAVAISSQDLIFLWTGNLELASSVAPIVSLLLIGTALNGVMIFPYSLQLAYGATRLALMITVVLIVVFFPTIVVLVMSYGAVGGAFAWALLNGVYLVLGAWTTHRHLLRGLAIRWLTRDVGVPLALSSAIVLLGWEFANVKGDHRMNLLLAGGLALLAFLACASMQGMSLARLWLPHQDNK